MQEASPHFGPPGPARRIGLYAGPMLAAALYLLLPQAVPHGARATAAVGALMATWWLSEAIPLEATSLLPIVLFPLLGVCGVRGAAAPYGSDVIFLFMGGLILGLAMERWGLHRRIALVALGLVGTRPAMLLAGLMAASGLISMWVSNTATTVMMLPIAVSIAALAQGSRGPGGRGGPGPGFTTAMMLGVAYAASIGGVGTLVGSPPNAILNGLAGRLEIRPAITFAGWMPVGCTVVALFMPLAWLVLVALYRVPRARLEGLTERVAAMKAGLGPMSRGEWATLLVFMAAAGLWITRVPVGRALGLIRTDPGGRPFEGLTDAGIAIAAALALFLIPVDRRGTRAMDWPTAVRLPWGVLLLFGGGLSLAEAMTTSGLDAQIGSALGVLSGLHPLLIVFCITALVVFLTEITSNTAVATTFLPIAHAVAGEIGVHPYTLMVPAAVAATYAFMMPVGTPPNALVFATGRVSIRQMASTGIVLNLIAIVLITAVCYWLAPGLLGYSLRAGGP
jgi:sodium-dependent dicarboxylate transporter 2/3/5